MNLEELVDISAFRKSLTPCDKSIFFIWKTTALEIERDRYQAISSAYDIWNEIPPEELRPDQIISFIEELLRILKDTEKQKLLIQTEALPFRTFA